MKRRSEICDLEIDVGRLWLDFGLDAAEREPTQVIAFESDQEFSRLREAIAELQASLEKATRRINRLIGERDQLKALLEARDGQIQDLNREMGARAIAVEPSVKGSENRSGVTEWLGSAIAPAMERMLVLFRKEPQSEKPLIVDRAEQRHERAPLIPRQGSGAVLPVVAIVLFGLEREEIERLLPMIQRDSFSKRFLPLCLVDSDAFELMRERDMMFEYLPPPEDRNRFDPDLRWDLYLQRRLALIRKKWRPVRIVAFGKAATNALALWSSSPFEEASLPTVAASAANG